jgi:hypothetical protein
MPGSVNGRWIQASGRTTTLFGGRHRRIFSDDEEQAIADFVTVHYLLPGNLFTDATFQHIAVQAFLEKFQESESPPQFDCSPRFITGFKKRNGFSC